MQHKENDYVLPALFVLFNHPEGIPTDQVKAEISQFVTLDTEDLEPYGSRNKNEPRYFQIVGNMISHKNSNFFKYVDRIMPVGDSETKNKHILVLNEEGKNYISSIIGSINVNNQPLENDTCSNGTVIDKYDQRIIYYANLNKNRICRDSKLAREVLEISQYKCQYALLANKNHKLFKTEDGKPYAEAHHLIPMKASKDFFPRNLDRASNLVCLCPNCHAILHHGSKEEKREILRILYDHYIEVLNNEDGIFISFEKLLEKYY